MVWVKLDRPIGSGDLWTTLELSKPRQMSGFSERMNKIENYETNVLEILKYQNPKKVFKTTTFIGVCDSICVLKQLVNVSFYQPATANFMTPSNSSFQVV